MKDPDYDEEDYLMEEDLDKENEIYHLYGSLGFFIVAFSKVELALTVLLATLLQEKDFEAFHTITRGLDAPAKAARIKELGENFGIFDQKNPFGDRLNLFKITLVGLRNRIGHSFITRPADQPILGFFDISYLSKDPKPVEYVASQEIMDLCKEWLNLFFEDLMQIILDARVRAKLSISHPKSMEPQLFRQKLQKLETSAKRSIRPKKASLKSE